MESWGRGIANIMDACKEAGLPKPEFIKAPWVTRIVFKFKTPLTPYLSGKSGNGSSGEPINEPLNYSNIQVKTTHDAIRSHPGIGRSGIMAQTGLSLPSVKRYIAELTAKGSLSIEVQRRPEATTPSTISNVCLSLFCRILYRVCTTNPVTH